MVTSTVAPIATEQTGVLDKLIAPRLRSEFISEVWTKVPLLISGDADRFAELFSWKLLSRLLAEHRLRIPQVRLFKDAKPVDPSLYMEIKGGKEPRLRPLGLQSAIDDGATLIIDRIQELHQPLQDLSIELEREFRAPVNINVYASAKSTNGFGVHWDDHDVLVLQIDGAKRWVIYKPTQPDPMRSTTQADDKPVGPPISEDTIESGTALYIPKGWWHVATPADGGSLHLTIGVVNPTGLDLLHWAVDQLKSRNEARKSLPHMRSGQEQAEFIAELTTLLASIDLTGSIEHYLNFKDAEAPETLTFSLPSRTPSLDSGRYSIRLVAPRKLKLHSFDAGENAVLACSGKKLSGDPEILTQLLVLNDGLVHEYGELLEPCADGISRGQLQAAILGLTRLGVVAIDRMSDDLSNV